MRFQWVKWTLIMVIVCASFTTAQAQFHVSGLMSLVARDGDVQSQHNKTNLGLSPFDAMSARVFFDGQVTDRLSGFVQFFVGNGYDVIPYGAYIRYDHSPSLHLDAGLIPLPVGLWGARTYANKNPLVGVPLMYQYKTSMNVRGSLQLVAEDILVGRGESGSTPLVYDFCWNTGIHGYASTGPIDFGLALQTGSLGNPSRDSRNDYPNVVAHINWVPGPWLTMGVWGATGPFLNVDESALPAGAALEDYHQQSVGGQGHFAYGHWDIYAEGVLNRFEHPYLGNLDASGGYLDVRYLFAPQWYGAVRVDGLRFSRLGRSIDPNQARWDYPLSRFEFGVGHKMTRQTTVKIVTQIVRFSNAPSSFDEEIYALQFVVGI